MRGSRRRGGMSAVALAASAALGALTRNMEAYATRRLQQGERSDVGEVEAEDASSGTTAYQLDLPIREAVGDAELALRPDGSWTVTFTVIPVNQPDEPRTKDGGTELPPLVDIVRSTIIKAARGQQYDVLEELAFAVSDEFTYSFDEPTVGGHPARYWSDLQNGGARILDDLCTLLALPFVESDGLYVWPGVANKPWDEVEASDREELERVFGEKQVSFWEELGSYAGYRIGISDRGDWRFFVAADQ